MSQCSAPQGNTNAYPPTPHCTNQFCTYPYVPKRATKFCVDQTSEITSSTTSGGLERTLRQPCLQANAWRRTPSIIALPTKLKPLGSCVALDVRTSNATPAACHTALRGWRHPGIEPRGCRQQFRKPTQAATAGTT